MRPADLPLMIFAAGFGTRMGALTARRPKPLIPVAGRALIDHALALAEAAGVRRVVVNTHYLGDQIAAHLAGRGVTVLHEAPEILDTGGGLKAALPHLGEGPVMTLNPDTIFTGANPLAQLADAWDPARMDALLLLLPAAEAQSATGRSDFVLSEGRIDWARGRPGHLYLGAQILRPELVRDVPERIFPLHGPWSRAIETGRAFGLVHRGGWCDVGHPEGIARAEALLAGRTDVR